MDQFLLPPGTPTGQSWLEIRVGELVADLQSDRDWAEVPGCSGLHGSPANIWTNGGITFIATTSTRIPPFPTTRASRHAQVGIPPIDFGTIEFNPSSGNQDQEFVDAGEQQSGRRRY